MADYAPVVECDLCGIHVPKVKSSIGNSYLSPREWLLVTTAGMEPRLPFKDLCPSCTEKVLDAWNALKKEEKREE